MVVMRFCLLLLLTLWAPMLARANTRLDVSGFSRGADPQAVPQDWQLKEKAGQADFALVQSEGLHALRLRSSNTSFCFQRRVHADLKDYPLLCWKWRVTQLPRGGDFRRSKTDDEAGQLYVAFSKTRAIVYLWDTSAPQGLMAKAPGPPFMSVKAVVVRSGPAQLGTWLSETRNVYEDYQRLYGKTDQPPVVSGMRLQINTQHTRSSAACSFADVGFRSY
jgi:hypothetical protein